MRSFFFMCRASCMVLLLLFSTACNNTDTDSAKKDKPDSTGPSALNVVVPNEADLLAGNLDTLWMDAASFISLGQGTRLTFRFYIQTTANVSLHGWVGNSNTWNNKPPDVRLSTGRQSTVEFGAGSYFGNLQISPNGYNAIKQKLTDTNSQYVVFGPVNPSSGSDAGEIYYKIYVTSDFPGNTSPGIIYKFLLEDTEVETNPSPPKNSN